MAAVYNDYPEVVKVLVQAGADIEKTDYVSYITAAVLSTSLFGLYMLYLKCTFDNGSLLL